MVSYSRRTPQIQFQTTGNNKLRLSCDDKMEFISVFIYLFFPRELCEEAMTQSVSSASSLDSHAPSECSGQALGPRWEEQKVLALEQLCGVFRVDLGHMRSLRLFFRSAGGHAWLRCRRPVFNQPSFSPLTFLSDDACTSGQLVIASRESQYKILHFHHAGLDKLAEVFQQWRCCRETQLKEQVGRLCPPIRSLCLVLKSEVRCLALASRCLLRNPACSSASRGPRCLRLKPTRRRSCTAGWTLASGCATSTRAVRWRKSINYARCVLLTPPPPALTFSLQKLHLPTVVLIDSTFSPQRVEPGQYSPVTHLSSPSMTLSKVCVLQK